jgi:hypothetical protein
MVDPTPSALPVEECARLLAIAPDASVREVQERVDALEQALERGESAFSKKLGESLERVWAGFQMAVERAGDEGMSEEVRDYSKKRLPPGVEPHEAEVLMRRLLGLRSACSA